MPPKITLITAALQRAPHSTVLKKNHKFYESFQELIDFFQEYSYLLIMSKFNDACEKILRPKGDLVVLPLEDLPNDVNNSLWVRIEQTYGLTLPELIALQNYSTARTSNKINSISLF